MPTEKAHGVSIAHMCAAFAAKGLHVKLVTPTRRNEIAEDIFSYYGVPRTFSVQTLAVPDFVGRGFTHPFFFFLQRLLFVRAAKRAGIAPGIVYTREPEVVVAFVKTHTVVYEAHRWPRGIANWLTACLVRRTALIVANSRGTESAAHECNLVRTVVAPNGFDPALFEGVAPSRAELGLPEGILALYVGSDAPWKGIEIVRDTARELTVAEDVSVAIVGNSSPPRHEGVLTEVGRIALHRVPSYLRNADILLLPNTAANEESERFTSPIKLFEYLAAGKAVIASDLPSIREILGREDALFVPPGDARALAGSIKKLAHDSQLRTRLAERSLALSAQYTWGERAGRIIRALDIKL